jgi:hypothetical protein
MKVLSHVDEPSSAGWSPMEYWVHEDLAGRGFYQASLVYDDCLSALKEKQITSFRLVPIRGVFRTSRFRAYYDFNLGWCN